MNHLGSRYQHSVVTMDGRFDARSLVDPKVAVEYTGCPNTGNPVQMTGRLYRLIRRLNPALILTYNWGSMDGVAAAALAASAPLIHTEDGFGAEEQVEQKRRRVWMRKLLLRSAFRVVLPSHTLERLAQTVWRLPSRRMQYIPNGVDVNHFQPAQRQEGEVVVGTVANLTPVKRQTLLIEACAEVHKAIPLRLILAGTGPERERLEERALGLGFRDRVEFLGLQEDVRSVYQRMDIFALSSITEQMPLSVLEAMASGLPVVSTAVGDVSSMLSQANQRYLTSDRAGYVRALAALAQDAGLRRQLGEHNRQRCCAEFSLSQMLKQYQVLYEAALEGRIGAGVA